MEKISSLRIAEQLNEAILSLSVNSELLFKETTNILLCKSILVGFSVSWKPKAS